MLIIVNNRSGAAWSATVTNHGEKQYTSRPSPPSSFRDLGYHRHSIRQQNPVTTQISTGPNRGLRYVTSIAVGAYTSTAFIHPDLNNPRSRFYRFHLHPSRLYLQKRRRRILIPLIKYSGLSVARGNVTFMVPDWERFYKRYG